MKRAKAELMPLNVGISEINPDKPAPVVTRRSDHVQPANLWAFMTWSIVSVCVSILNDSSTNLWLAVFRRPEVNDGGKLARLP
jgi:hypothetical protein